MIASLIETFGEAFATLRKANVPPQLFLEVMNTLFGSPIYANYGRMIAAEKFEPAGFALALGLKDVRLALGAAEELTAPMPLASLLKDQFLAAGQARAGLVKHRSEEHTSELQSPAMISYAVFCLKKKRRESRPATQGCDTDRNLLTPVSFPLRSPSFVNESFWTGSGPKQWESSSAGCAFRPTP